MNSSLKKNPLSILRMSAGVEKIADIFQKVRSGQKNKKQNPPKKYQKEKKVPLKHDQKFIQIYVLYTNN